MRAGNMKNRVFLSIAFLLLTLLIVVPLGGCEFSCSVSTASLSEATMCTAVDEDARPLDSTDVFSVDTPEIFCSVKLSHAPEGTAVKAQWVFIEGELGVTDYYLGEYELEADGTRYLSFSITSDAAWPKGSYEAVLFLNGEPKMNVPFTIE
jgi:hypothetical protein